MHDVTLFYRSFNVATLLYFLSHSNDMTSWLSSLAENVSCNVAPFFYHHSGDTTSCICYQTGNFTVWWYNILYLLSDRQLSLISKENVLCHIMLDKTEILLKVALSTINQTNESRLCYIKKLKHNIFLNELIYMIRC